MVGETGTLSGEEVAVGQGRFSRSLVLPFLAFILIAAVLLMLGRREYPELHTMLDTAMLFMSVVLASLLWEIGRRLDRGFPLWLAASFAVTGFFEFLHV